MRPLHDQRCESGIQTRRRPMKCHHHLMLHISDGVGEMDVAIDQSRQHSRAAQVNYPGAGRDGYAARRTYLSNFFALDENHFVVQHLARFRIEQSAGAYSFSFRSLRLRPKERRSKKKTQQPERNS